MTVDRGWKLQTYFYGRARFKGVLRQEKDTGLADIECHPLVPFLPPLGAIKDWNLDGKSLCAYRFFVGPLQ